MNPTLQTKAVTAKAAATKAAVTKAAPASHRPWLATAVVAIGMLIAGARLASLAGGFLPPVLRPPSAQQELVLTRADRDTGFGQLAWEKAVAGEPIPGFENAPRAFIEQVKAGRVDFYAVRVFDSHDEDRDVVSLDLDDAGTRGPIITTNSGQVEILPSVDSRPPVVAIQAIRDGSGINRVSVGFASQSGEFTSRILGEGETQTVNVRIRR